MALEMMAIECMTIVEREITAEKVGLVEAESTAMKGEMVETRAVKEGTVQNTTQPPS